MTSLNFRAMVLEARKAALKSQSSSNPLAEADDPYSGVPSLQYPTEILKGYDVVEEVEQEAVWFNDEGLVAGLEEFRVGNIPSVYYVPHFLSSAQHNDLITHIYSTPSERWTQLKRRRLQMWGGRPLAGGMMPEPMPEWLTALAPFLIQSKVFRKPFNHVLINEYQPGQGIMPHEDGPLYIPHVAILSLQSSVVMDIYAKPATQQNKVFSLLLEPGSLLVFRDDIYKTHYHGIEERTEDVLDGRVINIDAHHEARRGTTLPRDQTRVSLTIRIVKKVLRCSS